MNRQRRKAKGAETSISALQRLRICAPCEQPSFSPQPEAWANGLSTPLPACASGYGLDDFGCVRRPRQVFRLSALFVVRFSSGHPQRGGHDLSIPSRSMLSTSEALMP
jgi:hypothetical protein